MENEIFQWLTTATCAAWVGAKLTNCRRRRMPAGSIWLVQNGPAVLFLTKIIR